MRPAANSPLLLVTSTASFNHQMLKQILITKLFLAFVTFFTFTTTLMPSFTFTLITLTPSHFTAWEPQLLDWIGPTYRQQ